ncbi:fungal-specific transcription factor domain-containing protein [Geopyxis carbonaria]|nr:fungal-specific transcription factor domain-containing protein [Geopyxis carbonaria]
MSGENPYASHQVAATSHYSLQVPQTTASAFHPIAPEGAPLLGHSPLNYREEINGSFGNNHFRGDMMNGVAGGAHSRGQQQFPYHPSASMAQPPRGPSPHDGSSMQQWQSPYYGAPIPGSTPDSDFARRNSVRDAHPNTQPPFSPHDQNGPWDKPRGSFSHPHQSHDPNFAHPHNTGNQASTYNLAQQTFARPPPPPHRPVEPNAAPSPPTQYPNSPRTPISAHQMINANGMPVSQPFRQPNGHQPPLSVSTAPPGQNSEALDHRSDSVSSHTGNFNDSKHPSPSPAHPVRRMNGSRGSIGHPLAPTNANGAQVSFAENGVHRGSVYSGSNRSSKSYGALGENETKALGRRDSSLQNGLSNHYESSGDEREVKREARSRSGSINGSPSASRMELCEGQSPQPPGSARKIPKLEGLEQPLKKKGQPVLGDDGNEYFENEPVPDGVKLPPEWQIGTGKMTKGLLLPKMKDGISVNPEWGFTAGGKARQRLPQACVNCRQKKIRCVESDYDETICQHCMKMRITCERHIKDEEKKKKGRGDRTKSEGGGRSVSIASDIGIMDTKLMAPVRTNSKKRKQSEEGFGGNKKANRRTASRGGSICREPLNTALANASVPTSIPQSAPARTESRVALFPTMEENPMTVAAPLDMEAQSRMKYVNELREQQYGHGSQHGSSMADSSPLSSYASASPTTSISGLVLANNGFVEPHQNYASSSNSKNSGLSTSTPATLNGTPPIASSTIHHPLGEDPRHSELPGPVMLEYLVDVYFKNVYSQTYAFLHRPSFCEKEAMASHAPVLLFSICAVAARFSEHAALEEKFARQTRSLIMENYDTYTMENIQSMVNMGLHDFGSNNGQKAWIFAGMAVRMGAAMNLNLEKGKKDKSKSAISREIARRTYWSYYLMDRFNSYGVARPFLTQDHDCHIQLPCNQPSFTSGEFVATEHLLGPNPYNPGCGDRYMGAMAYLIHLSGFDTSPDPRDPRKPSASRNEFDDFISKLEAWRRSLPPGLQYSNENLAGQIKVGTTGAFVMMHVMWHTAMAYVHRYIRTVGIPKDYIEENVPKGFIVESIRKAFVHADAVLQIMYHVHEKKKAAEADPNADQITVNAPFLGQAISDACNITVIRALEVRGEPGGARDQKQRVTVGLEWLKDLKRYWKPVEGMYKRLKRTCKQMERSMSVPPSSNRSQQLAPTPDSSTGDSVAPLHPGYHYPVDPNNYDAEPTYTSGPINTNVDTVPLNSNFTQISDFLGLGTIPSFYFGEAFTGYYSQHALYHIASAEAGFPELYNAYEGVDMGSVSASFDTEMSGNVPIGPTDIAPDMHSSMHMQQLPPPPVTTAYEPEKVATSDVDVLEEDGSDNEETSGESPDKDTNESKDIHACYFDPVAVHDGKLQIDSASETSDHSRRTSEAVMKHSNPMDLFNFINPQSRQSLEETLLGPHPDEFTGLGGAAAPESGEMHSSRAICLDNQNEPASSSSNGDDNVQHGEHRGGGRGGGDAG